MKLRSDPKTVPKPSRDEMMRMPYEKPRQSREGLNKRIQKLVGNQCIGW